MRQLSVDFFPRSLHVRLTLNVDDIRFGSISAGSYWPLAAVRDRQLTADSVEKVGHGFHGRKVRV